MIAQGPSGQRGHDRGRGADHGRDGPADLERAKTHRPSQKRDLDLADGEDEEAAGKGGEQRRDLAPVEEVRDQRRYRDPNRRPQRASNEVHPEDRRRVSLAQRAPLNQRRRESEIADDRADPAERDRHACEPEIVRGEQMAEQDRNQRLRRLPEPDACHLPSNAAHDLASKIAVVEIIG